MKRTSPFKWTEAITKQCVDDWNAGESATTLGLKFGISRNAVVGRMNRLKDKGWDIRDGNAPPKPVTVGVSSYGKLPDPTEQWSHEQTESVITMWRAGKSILEIKTATDRTMGSVRGKIDLLSRRGLIVRDGSRRAEAIARPKKTKLQESYGVKAISFNELRQEDRVEAYTVQGHKTVAAFEAAMPNTGVPLMEIRAYQCRFPTSNGPLWLMCAEPVEGKSSYCPKCAERVYGRIAA